MVSSNEVDIALFTKILEYQTRSIIAALDKRFGAFNADMDLHHIDAAPAAQLHLAADVPHHPVEAFEKFASSRMR